MKILKDSFRQQYYRVVFQGLTLARLQSNSGKNILIKNSELEKLLISNGVYKNESWSIAETTPLTFNKN